MKNPMCNKNILAIIGDTGDPTDTPLVCLYKILLKANRVEFKHSFKGFRIKLMLNGISAR